MLFTIAHLAIFGLAALTTAHPGGHEHMSDSALLAKRAAYINTQRSLSACASKIQSSGLEARAIARRQAVVADLQNKLRKKKRDEETVLNTDHNRTALGYTSSTDESVIFASNGTCVINPVSEFGPFWVKGEYVRQDLVDDQPGVPVTIDGQFLNAETCEPIEGLYWDMW
jgi:hypothetical protein